MRIGFDRDAVSGRIDQVEAEGVSVGGGANVETSDGPGKDAVGHRGEGTGQSQIRKGWSWVRAEKPVEIGRSRESSAASRSGHRTGGVEGLSAPVPL